MIVCHCTNITDHEHLDYHGTFADYLAAKRLLFSHHTAGAAIVMAALFVHGLFLLGGCSTR